MLDWKILALVGPLCYAIFQSFSKLVPKGTSVFLINAYASLVGLIVMLTLHLLFSSNKSLVLNSKISLTAVSLGVFLSLGNLAVIKAYNLGAPQSIFAIIAYTVLIILGILFGVILWHEKLSLPIIFGTLLSIIGIVVVIYSKK